MTQTSDGSGRAHGVSRRSFIQTMGLSAAAGAVQARVEAQSDPEGGSATLGPEPVGVTLRINNEDRTVRVEPSQTLLDALRHELDMTGSKEICDRGACGGCSVLVDGKLVTSCMMLALDAEGAEITTIEGLAPDGIPNALQEAFVKHDALQCGYCTPGLVMACTAVLEKNDRPSLDEIKEGISGNICRCGTYTNIFNAVLEASGQQPLNDGLEVGDG